MSETQKTPELNRAQYAFYFFRGSFSLLKESIVRLICSTFRGIAVALLIMAFWKPLQAVGIFVLLFFISLIGSPVYIQPGFKNYCRGLCFWLRFLMTTPEELDE
jgi:hypothetical protein